MGFIKRSDRRPRVERQVMPEGCLGRIGTTTEITNSSTKEPRPEYKITTMLGCAGLAEGVVDVRTSHYRRNSTDRPNHERRKFEEDAVRQSAAQLVATCATCPLGPEGLRREQAQLLRSSPDDLQGRIELAREERAAAEARLAAAQLEVKSSRQLPPNQ